METTPMIYEQRKRERLTHAAPYEPPLLSRRLCRCSDPKHLGPARRTRAPGCRFAVFHRHGLGIPDLPLASTLDTIGFHPKYLNLIYFGWKRKPCIP